MLLIVSIVKLNTAYVDVYTSRGVSKILRGAVLASYHGQRHITAPCTLEFQRHILTSTILNVRIELKQ